jgi:hypothetical protein
MDFINGQWTSLMDNGRWTIISWLDGSMNKFGEKVSGLVIQVESQCNLWFCRRQNVH